MPEVKLVYVTLAHFAAKAELVLAHVVRDDVSQHAGDIVATGGIRDSHLFKSRNGDAGRTEDRLPVNERVRTSE